MMAVSRTQKELISLLRRYGLGAVDTFMIVVVAEETGTEDTVIEYLESIKDNPPDRKEIAVTAYKIATGEASDL